MKSQYGTVLWLTGLPCSGKSTIAAELEKSFLSEKKTVQVLDGDVLRNTISRDLGFSSEDRFEQCERAAHIANMLSGHGINVIVALVSPRRKMRAHAKEICVHMKEIYIRCDIEECKKRDVKGMYEMALKGEIKNFTGVQDIYESPLTPDLVVDTDKNSITQCVNMVMSSFKIGCFVWLALLCTGYHF